MRLLYTGANTYLGRQNDPTLSIGGYISSSVVPNSKLGNLFSDISANAKSIKAQECKAVIIDNNSTDTLSNVLVGYKYPTNPNFTLQIAFVAVADNDQKIEQLTNYDELPYYAVFSDADATNSDAGLVSVGDILANKRLAVWIKRNVNVTNPTFNSLQAEIDFYKAISDPDADITKTIQLIIKYSIIT